MRRTLLVLSLAALMAACGGADPTADPTDDGASRAGTLIGILEGDAGLEGGCAWLEPTGGPDAALDDQVQPIFPDGYRVEFEPDLHVLDRDGEVVAERGDELVVDGTADPDVATTCQVGTVYRVHEVLGVVGR